MWKKIIFLVLCSLLIQSCRAPGVFADECSSGSVQDRIGCLEGKVSSAQGQERTLSAQIDKINNEISLTTLKIEDTSDKLDRLSEDISSVSGKINRIEDSLAHVSEVLANRIGATYIAGRTDPVFYLLTANDFTDLLRRLDYFQIVQKHDKTLMIQMATTRKNYNDQKDLLVDKKKQVEQLSAELKAYQSDLASQNQQKQELLRDTQNDEQRYQTLLNQARAELAAFNNFVVISGGSGLLSGQTKCDDWGCYYNQRDTSWGAMALNHTGYTLADSGCLITSMAMVITHYGHKDVTPVTINSNSSNFASYYPAFLRFSVSAGGVTWNRQSISYSSIDGQLAAGKPVIVGIGSGPAHFVVLVSGSGGNYQMNDPYVEGGHNISFTSKYSLNSISEIDIVSS